MGDVMGRAERSHQRRRLALLSAAVAVLAACGGNDGAGADSTTAARPTTDAPLARRPPPPPPPPPGAPPDLPASEAEARRFLTQATFGPSDASTERLMRIGYGAWFTEQFAATQTRQQAIYDQLDAVHVQNVGFGIGEPGTLAAFWKTALTGEDQLRQRVAYALAQIFVISMQDSMVGGSGAGPSNYLDMLADKGLGNFRSLLESVTLHPLMGTYLAHLRNRGPNAATSPAAGLPAPVPDENFARELMQLFTIGLIKLKPDGTPLNSKFGEPQATYLPADVTGLAHVMTGFSFNCSYANPTQAEFCFFWGAPDSYAPQWLAPMAAYPTYHSTDAKAFLGTSIAAGSTNPSSDLKVALDLLFNHPNVGPFIGKQLIQRLVTSNPSPAYVKAVGLAFDNNGAGVRGDMRAVIKTILTHAEAKQLSNTSGKIREPLLRMSAAWRGVGVTSTSGAYGVQNTDDAAYALGQTVLRAPSVFNFYRPGFMAPLSASAGAGLVAPELQIMHETTAAGYVNYLYEAVRLGSGKDPLAPNYYDVQFDTAWLDALAPTPTALVAALNTKLFYGSMSSALSGAIVAAISDGAVPTGLRAKYALILALASPEYQTQR